MVPVVKDIHMQVLGEVWQVNVTHVSKCYASWCNLYKLFLLHSLKVATGEKEPCNLELENCGHTGGLRS